MRPLQITGLAKSEKRNVSITTTQFELTWLNDKGPAPKGRLHAVRKNTR